MERKGKYLIGGAMATSAVVGGLVTEGVRRVLPPSSNIASVSQDLETGRVRVTLESPGILGQGSNHNMLSRKVRPIEYEPSFYGLGLSAGDMYREANRQPFIEVSHLKKCKEEEANLSQ